jgi:hypothetical protein
MPSRVFRLSVATEKNKTAEGSLFVVIMKVTRRSVFVSPRFSALLCTTKYNSFT